MSEKAKKPVMDVEKPGATPATATSRPLIVSKGPAIKDPMVNNDETQSSEDQVMSSAKKKTIQPLSETEVKAPERPVDEVAKEANTSSDQPVPEDTPVEETSEAKADAAIQQVTDEDQKRQELVSKLVLEKKYFVPVGAVQKKRTARAAVLFLLGLVLLVAGAVLAIDAELISTSVNLPFDLIK